MIDRLSESLNFYSQALNLRTERQKVLASNIANSDTPDYKARDFDFASALHAAVDGRQGAGAEGGLALATDAPGHIGGQAPATAADGVELAYRNPDQPSLDGNTVDMNAERVQFMDNAVHYRADLQILGSQIKSLKSAMAPTG